MFRYLSANCVFLSSLLAIIYVANAVIVTQPPQNVTALVGSKVTLNCDLQGTVGIFFWLIDVGTGIYIYYLPNGGSLSWGVNIDTTKFQQVNRYDLAMNNVSITDGSVYRCSALDNTFARSAVVIVTQIPVVSVPTVAVAGSSVSLTCNVTFGGPDSSRMTDSQYPVLSMIIGGQIFSDSVAPLVRNVTVRQSNQNIYFLSRTVNYTAKASDNGAVIQCTVSTSDPSFTTNSSTQLIVHSPTSNLQLPPDQSVFLVNDQVNCTASGYPPPIYTWTSVQTPATGFIINSDSILKIRKDMIGYNVWNCTASNYLGSQSQQISFNVTENPSTAWFPGNSMTTLPFGSSGTLNDTVNPGEALNTPSPVTGDDSWKLALGLGVGLGVGIPLLVLLIVIIVCCIRRCCKASAKSQTNAPSQQSQQLGMPPAYSSSSQPHNNNELALDADSSLAPPVYAEIVRKSVNIQTQPAKSGAEISGFGDVSFGNWSGQDLSPKVLNNATGAPSQSNQTKPFSGHMPQRNTNLSVGGLPNPVDEMEGYINLSYTANDEGNASNLPDEVWLNERSPENSIQSLQKFDWPDRHTAANIDYRSQPPYLESDSDSDDDETLRNPGQNYPVHLQTAAPVPQPRLSLGSYNGIVDPQDYPSQARPTPNPYRYPEPPLYSNNLNFIRDRESEPTVYYTAADPSLRFNAPGYDHDEQMPDVRNIGQIQSYAPYVNGRPYDNNLPPASRPFSPGRSFDSAESNERSYGNQAFDAGSHFNTPQDLSYRSNQMLQVLGASRSIDV